MMNILLSSAYLAPVSYYVRLYAAGTVYVEQYDHYQKQTYRNRCVIASANGPLTLSIPVVKYEGEKCLMKDIRISDHGNWRHLHWNALVAAYHTSPFFEYYQDDFRPFYEQKYEFLYDFNEALRQKVCELIDIQPDVYPTSGYGQCLSFQDGATGQPVSDVVDCREQIHPKRELTDSPSFRLLPYYQVFQQKYGFLPDLSIIDLLMNMGPESLLVLRDSMVKG